MLHCHLSSFFFLSNNQASRELVNVFQLRRHHQLSLLDQQRLFLHDVGVQVRCNFIVACRCFSNNKVQKDDAGDNYDDDPNKPKDYVFFGLKQVGLIEAKVTHGNSQDCENVSNVMTNILVFGAWIG